MERFKTRTFWNFLMENTGGTKENEGSTIITFSYSNSIEIVIIIPYSLDIFLTTYHAITSIFQFLTKQYTTKSKQNQL